MAHDCPAVTVVIPTRNRSTLMRRAIRCVLDQTGVDLEIVVVDDGSADDTPAALRSIPDPRLHFVRHDRARGTCAARNAGISQARGRWVAFLDDDDLWAPTKVARQLAVLRDGAARWSCSAAVTVDESLRIIGWHKAPADGDVSRALLSHNVIPGGGSAVLAETQLLRELGGFDEQLRHEGDWELWIRLALTSRVAVVPDPLVAWTIHSGGLSRLTSEWEPEVAAVHERYRSERTERGVVIDSLALQRWLAELDLRSGRRLTSARRHFSVAFSARDWRAFVVGATGLVWPEFIGWRDTRRASRLQGPAATALDWIASIRAAPATAMGR